MEPYLPEIHKQDKNRIVVDEFSVEDGIIRFVSSKLPEASRTRAVVGFFLFREDHAKAPDDKWKDDMSAIKQLGKKTNQSSKN
jgi:hypothetical protein